MKLKYTNGTYTVPFSGTYYIVQKEQRKEVYLNKGESIDLKEVNSITLLNKGTREIEDLLLDETKNLHYESNSEEYYEVINWQEENDEE